MREILYIAHRVPFPPDRGDKIRSYHQLCHLAELAPVHLAALADDPRDLHPEPLTALTRSCCIVPRRRVRPLAALGGLVRCEPLSVALFRDRRLQAYVDRIVRTRPLAAVVVFSGQMAGYVPPLAVPTRFIMDFCDVDSRKFAAYGSEGHGPGAWVNRREGRLLAAFEQETARRADASLFVSANEAALFRTSAGANAGRLSVVENGVDTDRYDPQAFHPRPDALTSADRPVILFTGQMDYRPNIEACRQFVLHSLPVVRAARPQVQFAIVGRNPLPAVQELAAEPGVIVTGEVPDVRPFLAHADVVVAPLRTARGIQNKVLEAMAMGRPVVASAAAAEGIDAVDGRDFLIARDSADEPRLTLAVLADSTKAAQLGAAARRRVVERYGWEATLAPLGPLVFGDAR